MSRNVSKDDVLKAYEALDEKGSKITQASVRRELGNRGSYETISKYLREIREEKGEIDKIDSATLNQVINNSMVRQSLEKLVAVSGHCVSTANQDEYIAQLEKDNEDLTRELNVTKEQMNKMEGALNALQGVNITELVERVTKLENAVQQKDEELKRKSLELDKAYEFANKKSNSDERK